LVNMLLIWSDMSTEKNVPTRLVVWSRCESWWPLGKRKGPSRCGSSI